MADHGSEWFQELKNSSEKSAKGRREKYRELTEEDFFGYDDDDFEF